MSDSILHNQTNAEYHEHPALGSTTIKEWSLKSPAHAMHGERTINSYIAAEGTAAHFVFEVKPDKVLEVTCEPFNIKGREVSPR